MLSTENVKKLYLLPSFQAFMIIVLLAVMYRVTLYFMDVLNGNEWVKDCNNSQTYAKESVFKKGGKVAVL